MKTRFWLAGFIGILTAGWAWDALYVHPMTGELPWLLRQHGLYLTGLLSIGLFSLTMILAVRPAWLEGPLGGMDKIYRLHKWSGILAIAFAAAHWLIEMAGDPLKEIYGTSGRPAGQGSRVFSIAALALRSQGSRRVCDLRLAGHAGDCLVEAFSLSAMATVAQGDAGAVSDGGFSRRGAHAGCVLVRADRVHT